MQASFVLGSLCQNTATFLSLHIMRPKVIVRSEFCSLFVFFPPQQRRRLDTDHADWCCAVIPSPAESVSHARERAFVLSARSNVRCCYNETSTSVNRQRPESFAELNTQRREIAAFGTVSKMNTSTARSRVAECDYARECDSGKTPCLISHRHHHHDNRAHQQPITAFRDPSCPLIGSPDLQPVVECPSFCCHAHI